MYKFEVEQDLQKEIELTLIVINRGGWSQRVFDYAYEQEPSSHKAQAYNIGHKLKTCTTSIAQMMFDDHRAVDSAMRHSNILIECGLAKHVQTEQQKKQHLYGYFEYEDGSVLNQFGVAVEAE